MSNLAKFDNTLKEFTDEVGKLKDVSAAYQKLKASTASYGEITKQFDANSKELGEIIELVKTGQEKLDQGISGLLTATKQNKSELAKLLDEKLEQLRKENKDFYKELESTIRIKLDDNRSQIKQLIESERGRIKEIFEIEFARNTQELQKTIQLESESQTKKLLASQQAIKYTLWFLGGATLLLVIVHTFKLI